MKLGRRPKSDVITYCIVLAIALGIATHFFKRHQQKVAEEKAAHVRSLAEKERVRSTLRSLKLTWDADDNWEREFSKPGAIAPAYSLDVERALVRNHPIIIFGTVDDVRGGGGQDQKLILVENDVYSKFNLRFSLSASPELANFISSQSHGDELAQLDTIVCVATIQSVEKVEGSSDQNEDESDYFLAHGVLRAAYPTHLFALDPKEVLGD